MDCRFWLRRAALGPQVLVPISALRFEELKRARETLADAGTFEHRYEILLGNYLELERFCAEWSLRGEVEMDHRHETWARVIIAANRHMMNLLSAARSYSDHVVQDFKHVSLCPGFNEHARSLLNGAYDDYPSYRFLAALRNYVQHRATPVHGIKQSLSGKSPMDSMLIYCSQAKLREDPDFKKNVLDGFDETIDLREVARSYMGAIGKVHVALRAAVSAVVNQARKDVQTAIVDFVDAQAKPESGAQGIGLTVCREVNGEFVDVHPILLGWDDARVLLAEKNRFPIKL